jgi:carboxymethylenebutenolidase
MSRPIDLSPLIPRATGGQTWTRRRVTAALGGLLMTAVAAPAGAQEAEPPLDPRLAADTVTFQVRKHIFKGSLVRPRVGPKRPGILLIPDQRGPNPYWRGLARRLAMDGFVVLLPDLLAPFNLPEGSDEGLNLMARIIPAEHQLALDAAADLLAKHPECNGSIAVIGFVWGGPYAMHFAISGARVKAAVIYYATMPSPEKVATAKVPVLFHWAENDPRTAPQVEAVEKRMIGAARVFESWVYPGLAGGFASDPASRTFDKDAADRAYERTVFFLRRHFGITG